MAVHKDPNTTRVIPALDGSSGGDRHIPMVVMVVVVLLLLLVVLVLVLALLLLVLVLVLVLVLTIKSPRTADSHPSGLAMSLLAIAPNPFPGMGRISSLQLDTGLCVSGAEAAHAGFKL